MNANFGQDTTWTDFDTLPRIKCDINGDGLDDIVGFDSNGV